MSQHQEYYHCERCNLLFRAPLRAGQSAICTHCRKSPGDDKSYHSVEELEKVKATVGDHGVAGRDIADFVSMQKQRRRRQLQWAFVMWILLLIVGGGVAVYFRGQNTNQAGLSAQELAERNERIAFRQRQAKASTGCLMAFDRFINSQDDNSRSEYVLDGVRQLLKMQEFYESNPQFRGGKNMRIIGAELREDQMLPRFDLLIESNGDQRIEAAFWLEDGEWKLDWEHFVRYSPKDWNQFIYDKAQGSVGEFRLFVRRRTTVGDEGNTLQLLFYQPKQAGQGRLSESPQVSLPINDPMAKQLIAGFEKLEQERDDREKREQLIFGRYDDPGMLRVTAKLHFEEGEDGSPNLILDQITAMDWLSKPNPAQ